MSGKESRRTSLFIRSDNIPIATVEIADTTSIETPDMATYIAAFLRPSAYSK